MNLGKIYLPKHPEIRREVTDNDITKVFEDDIFYVPYRKFQHPIYGKLNLYRETTTNRIIMANSENFDNFDAAKDAIAILKARQKLNQSNLIYLFDFSGQKIQNFCSTTFIITKYLEFPLTSLSKDIRERQTKDEYFTPREISLLTSQMLKVLSHLHSKDVYHGNVSTVSIQHRRANQMFVLLDYINSNDDLTSFHSKNQMDTFESFVSPELYTELSESHGINVDPFKNDLFSLGMVILSTGLLKPVQDCYRSGGYFDETSLERLMKQFKTKYDNSEYCISGTLELLLKIDPRQRINATAAREHFNTSLTRHRNEKYINQLSDFSEISAISSEEKSGLNHGNYKGHSGNSEQHTQTRIIGVSNERKAVNKANQNFPRQETVSRDKKLNVLMRDESGKPVRNPLFEFNSPLLQRKGSIVTTDKPPIDQQSPPTDKKLIFLSKVTSDRALFLNTQNINYDNFFENKLSSIYKKEELQNNVKQGRIVENMPVQRPNLVLQTKQVQVENPHLTRRESFANNSINVYQAPVLENHQYYSNMRISPSPMKPIAMYRDSNQPQMNVSSIPKNITYMTKEQNSSLIKNQNKDIVPKNNFYVENTQSQRQLITKPTMIKPVPLIFPKVQSNLYRNYQTNPINQVFKSSFEGTIGLENRMKQANFLRPQTEYYEVLPTDRFDQIPLSNVHKLEQVNSPKEVQFTNVYKRDSEFERETVKRISNQEHQFTSTREIPSQSGLKFVQVGQKEVELKVRPAMTEREYFGGLGGRNLVHNSTQNTNVVVGLNRRQVFVPSNTFSKVSKR